MCTSQNPHHQNLFEWFASPSTRNRFFAHVSDDVRWTVMGRHPLARTYEDKEDFLRNNLDRITAVVRDGLRFSVREVHSCGDVAVAEMDGLSTALDGLPYDQKYVFVCHFHAGQVVQVRQYADSALVSETLERNETRNVMGEQNDSG